jgi:hypothetical protein
LKLHPTTVHLTAVLVKYETPTGRLNRGVATTFLAQKHPQEGQPLPRAPIFIRKSQFRLPTKPETPIIMIGPGTGLAPFRFDGIFFKLTIILFNLFAEVSFKNAISLAKTANKSVIQFFTLDVGKSLRIIFIKRFVEQNLKIY